jgi:hypothetical protein
VSGPATLWAVFKLEEDIREIVHPEWFKYSLSYFSAPNDETIHGLKITPKIASLQGKITIPSYVVYEGEEYPVVSIEGFGNQSEIKVTQKITHIFMEKRKDNKKN